MKKIFGYIESGLAYIHKIKKILESVDCIARHATAAVKELKDIHGVKEDENPVEETQN
jgi:hypothetical protein